MATIAGAILQAAGFRPGASGILFQSDNAADIGAAAANRPRDVFVARNVTASGTAHYFGSSNFPNITVSVQVGANGNAGFSWYSSGATANNRMWRMYSTNSDTLVLDLPNDAASAAGTLITFTRSGTSPGTTTFGAAVGATEFQVSATKVVGAQGAVVADAAGGATVDAEARTAINTLLARVRAHGLIAT